MIALHQWKFFLYWGEDKIQKSGRSGKHSKKQTAHIQPGTLNFCHCILKTKVPSVTSVHSCFSDQLFVCIQLNGKDGRNASPEQFPLPASVSLPQSPRVSVWSGEVLCSEHLLCLQPRMRSGGVNHVTCANASALMDVSHKYHGFRI